MRGAALLNLASAAVNFVAWHWGSHNDANLFFVGFNLGVAAILITMALTRWAE